ncbi:MAG: LPS export ABC transporter periplasmic protein LptC [Xanthomonadales bacterium]|nr:LPS export ABC transporter periplasmic protein LptC [Xanthomonadales bacterium]
MITGKTRRGISALVLLSAFSFWLSRSQDNDSPEPVAGLDPKLNYVLRDFELQFFDEFGKPTVNMQAPVLRNDPKLQLGTIERPVVKLNQANAVWDMTSDTATVTADKEHVKLIGQVNATRNEPVTGNWVELRTREIQIEVTPQTAITHEPVIIFDGLNRVDAIGLELDMKSKTYSLKQQVRATYAVN